MEWLKEWIEGRRQQGNLRRLRPVERLAAGRLQPLGSQAPPWLDFSSNDYLALSTDPRVIGASREALEKYGTGAGAARLMSGDLVLFHELEEAVAQLKGKAAGLLFGSGYMANTGVISALVGRGDTILCDRLNHASIYDGCLLSGAELKRFRHNDLDQLETLLKQKRAGKTLMVVESIYSMDGDCAPLKEIVRLKEKYGGLLMVDEAHATGIFGDNGGGLIEALGVAAGVDIAMGTFGKALGSYGAYIAADRLLVDYLINRARSFVYSTALPPAVAAASLAAVKIVQQEPQLRTELKAKVDFFKARLTEGGINDDLGPSQIVPILIGDSARAVGIADRLYQQRIFATAVRPPTVPENTARLRFSITRHLSDQDLGFCAGQLLAALSRSQ